MRSIVTHQNWRGQFSRGTWGEGTGRVGQSSDCAAWPSPVECVPVPWPGWNTNAWHEDAAKPKTVGTDTYWLGSLSVGMRDASGQMYMRNRYYNPQTGQFTQPDPIGLAGGLNSYGFAAGDPVTYTDPYGLSATAGCDPPQSLRCRARAAGSFLLGFVPVISDGNDVATAISGRDVVAGEDVGTLGRIAAGAGVVLPVSGGHIRAIGEGVERIGKRFTRAGRRDVVEANRAVNGGQTVCANCGVETVPAQQHTRGVTPPGNETHVDHVQARSRGGAGVPANGQVLCRECNIKKRDQEDE